MMNKNKNIDGIMLKMYTNFLSGSEAFFQQNRVLTHQQTKIYQSLKQ